VKCSLEACNEEVLGTAVILSDADGEGVNWSEGGFNAYTTMSPEGEREMVILHPNCFLSIFQALTEGEGMTTLNLMYCPVGIIKEELQMT
jgi:hypothetical protein